MGRVAPRMVPYQNRLRNVDQLDLDDHHGLPEEVEGTDKISS